MGSFKTEDSFRKVLVSKLDLVKFARIENRVGSGIPDLMYALGERKAGFIELKVVQNRNHRVNLRESQKIFFSHFCHSFNTWLLIGMRQENAAFIIDGVMIDQLVKAEASIKIDDIEHHGKSFNFGGIGSWESLYRHIYRESHGKTILPQQV